MWLKPKGSDATVREHLLRVQDVTGKVPKELAAQPPCPEELRYMWGWFCELQGEASFAELDAWARVMGRRLQPYEVRMLRWMVNKHRTLLRSNV